MYSLSWGCVQQAAHLAVGAAQSASVCVAPVVSLKPQALARTLAVGGNCLHGWGAYLKVLELSSFHVAMEQIHLTGHIKAPILYLNIAQHGDICTLCICMFALHI